jgi:glutathione synthase
MTAMQLLFVADPLAGFNTAKDSTFAMMREAAKRGHTVFACEAGQLRWQQGGVVVADGAVEIALTGRSGYGVKDWYTVVAKHTGDAALPLRGFGRSAPGAVVMRQDPPFNSEYFYATHLLEQAEREGAAVFNKPRALRDHPEKLAILEFQGLITPTLVTRQAQAVRDFHAQHRDIILKPLDGMGGAGIFRIGPDGMNLGSVIETLNLGGQQTLMVQRYVPEITQGDKRILLIDGVAVPFSLARIPQGSEIRGNLAVGGKGVAQPLSASDVRIAEALGPTLAARGLLLVGIDVIGDVLTEINVTSPTCFQEITDQTGFDVAARFVDALEARVQAP